VTSAVANWVTEQAMPDMRLSDAERQDALDALAEHVRTGRLDLDEYGERSARVTAARRVSDLAPLFDDLPSPRPSALVVGASAPIEPAGNDGTMTRWMYASAVPIAVVLAVAVFVLTRGRVLLIFFLPMIVAMLVGAARRRR
jgi:hypothetical protein